MAAEILDGWAPIIVELGLRTGTRGVFDIELDGETLFSKRAAGRRPEAGEVAGLMEARLGPPLAWRSRDRAW